jgi:hypothetical protein
MLKRNLVNAVLFQLGWFACVIGGDIIALLWTVPYLILHFLYISTQGKEWQFVLFVAVLGSILDAAAIAAGMFSVSSALPLPVWLICLWLLFGTLIPHGLSWLRGRSWLAALFGAIGGSMSYIAGVRLGAASTDNLMVSSLIWATQWALLLPLLLAIAERWLQREKPASLHSAV